MKDLNKLKQNTIYEYLRKKDQAFIDELHNKYFFTFQEDLVKIYF